MAGGYSDGSSPFLETITSKDARHSINDYASRRQKVWFSCYLSTKLGNVGLEISKRVVG